MVPAGHCFSLGLIGLFLRIVLAAPASMRSAASLLELFGGHLPYVDRTPCANTGRLWLLRVGLYRLRCEKEQADDWVWMMDHTMQLGPKKCLMIVGIRLKDWEPDRGPLQHEDMTLLNLTPMEQSTGEKVHEQLCAVLEKTGRPRAVVSDGGSDLKRAMEQFREDHPDVHHISDMKHKNATLLKKELQSDERWASFVTQANRCKLGVTQTALAFLNPPSLKTKARYMNLDTLVHWGRRVLEYLDEPIEVLDEPIDRDKLHEKLGWLRDYGEALESWAELLAVVRATEEYVHREGVHHGMRRDLEKELSPLVSTGAGRRLVDALLGFVTVQTAPLSEGERLPGSTEVVESILGKYKRLQSSHSKGGMTAMLLSIGAFVGRQTTSLLTSALESVTVSDVTRWCETHLGVTIQSQRKRALCATKME